MVWRRGASALAAAMGGVGGAQVGQQRSSELRLSAVEFLDRIAALIPPPVKHRQRYVGGTGAELTVGGAGDGAGRPAADGGEQGTPAKDGARSAGAVRAV